MSETETTTETTAEDTTATIEAIAATRERVAPYIHAAKKLGMDFRSINGLMIRTGERLGIDLDAIGGQTFDAKDNDDLPDDEFYDDVMRACWLLCEDAEVLIDLEGDQSAVTKAFRRWQFAHLKGQAADFAAMQAFLARWFEWRLESAEAITGEAI